MLRREEWRATGSRVTRGQGQWERWLLRKAFVRIQGE